MKIIKRNGIEQDYDITKIKRVILLANSQVSGTDRIPLGEIDNIVNEIDIKIKQFNSVSVETIQDKVEEALVQHNYYAVAKGFIIFRNDKLTKKKFTPTEEKVLSITDCKAEDVSGDNANKNPIVLPTQRDYISGTICKSIADKILPKDVVEANNSGEIHYHDKDYSPVMHMSNCGLIDLKRMFEKGFLLNKTWIEPPHSFLTTCNIASQVALHASSQQYGGLTMSWAHIAKFVDISRSKIRSAIREMFIFMGAPELCNSQKFDELVEQRVKEEIKNGVQTFQYQLITLQGTNGQSPFITMSLDFNDCDSEQNEKDLALVIEEVLKQRIKGILNENKVWRPVEFPKLIWVPDNELTLNETDKYGYLKPLVAECITKTMQPDIFSAKVSRELKDGQVIKPMGCRSCLTPYYEQKTLTNMDMWCRLDTTKKWIKLKDITLTDRFNNGYKVLKINNDSVEVLEPITWGRFNQGVVTINLPYVALKSKRNGVDYYTELDKTLEICRKALKTRNESLKKVKAENAPMLWRFAYLEKKPNESISDYLTAKNGGYSTISLGYVGLYETVQALIGESNTTENGSKLAYEILEYLNKKLAQWKEEDDLPYSIYGTPEEQTTQKFAQSLKREFGKIDHVTDHDYVTNSYHVNPAESINAFDKLKFESRYLAVSTGGAVSYIEASTNISKNIPAVIKLIDYMADNILYAEINTKLDYCFECGSTEELDLHLNEHNKYLFRCKICGNNDQTKLSGIRRLCGYIGEVAHGISPTSPASNQGRLSDIFARVVHI